MLKLLATLLELELIVVFVLTTNLQYLLFLMRQVLSALLDVRLPDAILDVVYDFDCLSRLSALLDVRLPDASLFPFCAHYKPCVLLSKLPPFFFLQRALLPILFALLFPLLPIPFPLLPIPFWQMLQLSLHIPLGT